VLETEGYVPGDAGGLSIPAVLCSDVGCLGPSARAIQNLVTVKDSQELNKGTVGDTGVIFHCH
jgi:hypothetical protein